MLRRQIKDKRIDSKKDEWVLRNINLFGDLTTKHLRLRYKSEDEKLEDYRRMIYTTHFIKEHREEILAAIPELAKVYATYGPGCTQCNERKATKVIRNAIINTDFAFLREDVSDNPDIGEWTEAVPTVPKVTGTTVTKPSKVKKKKKKATKK